MIKCPRNSRIVCEADNTKACASCCMEKEETFDFEDFERMIAAERMATVESKDYLKEAQDLIFSDCKLSDTKTPSVSVTLFTKTVAKLLMKIDALKKE